MALKVFVSLPGFRQEMNKRVPSYHGDKIRAIVDIP